MKLWDILDVYHDEDNVGPRPGVFPSLHRDFQPPPYMKESGKETT